MHDAANAFFVGVNLPWISYGGDFGASAWHPEGGVGRPGQRERLDEVFARLAGAGLRCVRWFLLCDGRSGLELDADGVPVSLDRFFWRDLETAVAGASRHAISLTLVLFDFPWFARRRVVHSVQLGGRRSLLARPPARRLLLDRIVRPVLQRYGSEPAIGSWDLFNEPEWATFGYGSLNPFNSLRPAAMRALLGDVLDLVHREARQPATIGLAMPRGIRLVRGLPLDLYQFHWYDRRSRFLRPPSAECGGKPVLLGEFPTEGSRLRPEEILDEAERLGYCGALGWSAIAGDQHSRLEALEGALTSSRRPPQPRRGASAE